VPPVDAVMETDDALRVRVPEAFEGLSVAKPTAAYEFHAKSADGRVQDVSATSPSPASVVITVLSREGNGEAAEDLLATVNTALNAETVRPEADRVTVQGATIHDYRVKAKLHLFDGVAAGLALRRLMCSWPLTSPIRKSWAGACTASPTGRCCACPAWTGWR